MLSRQNFQELLKKSAERHSHLCPRQVLGVRIGMAGAHWLGLDVPRQDKRLLVIIETDGCFTDGIEVATGVTVGQRRLRIEDYGKVAATFVDTLTGQAVRIFPHPEARHTAVQYAPEAANLYDAQLFGYQSMPDKVLLECVQVVLKQSIDEILSKPGLRVDCDLCGEEIMNERQLKQDGRTLCRSCAGYSYFSQA
jgi:formylmethanofuran dehydrogenase subunit E